MTPELWIAIIAAAPPTIVALATLVTALGNRRRQRKMHNENAGKLDTLTTLMVRHVKESRKKRKPKKRRS